MARSDPESFTSLGVHLYDPYAIDTITADDGSLIVTADPLPGFQLCLSPGVIRKLARTIGYGPREDTE